MVDRHRRSHLTAMNVAGHDPLFMTLAWAIAALGTYTALDLAERARTAARRRWMWLNAAGLALGAGIWAMHFVATITYRAPSPSDYGLGLNVVAFALAVAASIGGLFAVKWGWPRRHTLAVAGTLMGLAIAAMHQLGPGSLRAAASSGWNGWLVLASMILAVATATAVLWLARRPLATWQKVTGGMTTALALVVMHYATTGAAGLGGAVARSAGEASAPPMLATGIALMVMGLLIMALALALIDRYRVARRSLVQEAQYRAVVDTAVDPILIIDDTGIIVSFNRAAEATFGYFASEAVGRNVSFLMPEPDRSAHDGYLRRYHRTGERRIIGIGREVKAQRKDGSVFPVELSVAEWRAGGRRHYTGILRDITGRKQAEHALRQAKERAERADAAKSKFLAAASHDLRQPVQSLFFFAYALGEKLKGHSAATMVASMSESLDALRLLLDSLLDVSRLDAGVVQPNVTEFAVGPLLERLGTEYRPRAEERGLRFRVAATRAWTRSDPVLLERLLRNLVENAVRYTNSGGVLIGCRQRGDQLRLEVWDTGAGIPAERSEDVFEEFFQLGNPERDRQQGLGLGLAIVRRLARLLAHTVELRSRPGRGTVFSVGLPRVSPRAIPKPVVEVPVKANARGLVVVIDDDELVLVGLRSMLQTWGYEVVAALSADEAIDTLLKIGRRPCAVVADYRLREGRTGIQAIRDVFGVCGVRVPAVVLTGDTAPERISEVENSGFALLHKPVAPDRLRELLQRHAA